MRTLAKKEMRTGNHSFADPLDKEAVRKRMNGAKENLLRPSKESRFYGEGIEVERADHSFYPSAFFWRGQTYTVTKIIHAWPDWGYGTGVLAKKNWRLRHHRNYFVVQTDTDQVFKIYRDRGVKGSSNKVWILNEELLAFHPQKRPSKARGLPGAEKKRNKSPTRASSDKNSGK